MVMLAAADVCSRRHPCRCVTTLTFVKPVRDSVEYKLFLAGSCYLYGFTRRCRLVVKIVLVHKGLEREEGNMQYIVLLL